MTRGAVALRAVEALLCELAAADKFSGVVGVAQGDQELLLEAFGYASRTWGIPATVETRFDTASITKLFTAVATLQLVEHGAFALDTSVTGYLGLEDTGISTEVTPYHLLTHTSGIADDADEEAGERYEDLFVERPNYSVTETADYLPQFVGKPPNFAPGEGCRSYPPVGGPDGGAHVTVGDLLRFHLAVTEGRLLGPALTHELRLPKARHSARGTGSHLMGFGFEFETDADDVVRSYWKEGVNVGVSGMLRHYPMQDITVAVLAVRENAAWAPIKAIDEAVGV